MSKVTKSGSRYTDFSMKGMPTSETEKKCYNVTFLAKMYSSKKVEMHLATTILPNKKSKVGYQVVNLNASLDSIDRTLWFDGLSKATIAVEMIESDY